MQKTKLLALTLSAISTGILISCAKPVEEDTGADAEKAKQNAEASNKTANSAPAKTTEQETTEQAPTETTAKKSTSTAPTIQAIELPADKSIAYLQHVSKDIITPLYNNASETSKTLNNQAVAMCQAGSLTAQQVAELRTQWLSLAKAWAKAEAINFGSANDNMTNLYINYFPDERGLVHKSVKRLITDNPQLKPEQFVDESAVVQGIPALEDILYTNDTLDSSQCNYLISASSELNRRLENIANSWEKDGTSLLDTANPATGMNQYFNSLLFHIENLKSTGVDKPLALNSKKKGHVPAHVAGESQAIIKAKLDILQTALSDSQLTSLLADSEEGKKIMAQMTSTITETESHLATMPADISKAEKTKQTELYDNLTTLTKQLKRGIMPLLGVQLGFNSTDGD